MASFPSKCQSLFTTAVKQSQRDILVKTKRLHLQRDTANSFIASKRPPFSTLQFENWKSGASKWRSVPVVSPLSPGRSLQGAFAHFGAVQTPEPAWAALRLLLCDSTGWGVQQIAKLCHANHSPSPSPCRTRNHEVKVQHLLSQLLIYPAPENFSIAWLENTGNLWSRFEALTCQNTPGSTLSTMMSPCSSVQKLCFESSTILLAQHCAIQLVSVRFSMVGML